MSLRVLGPVEASLDGVTVDLGSRKQRIALAVLAAAANRPVASDRLIAEIWGETPPIKAKHALQTYVSNLRRLIGKQRIERTHSGYVLHLGSEDYDLAAFEEAVASDDPRGGREETISRLSGALGLWRADDAFGGLADEAPILQQEAARLAELKVSAEETLLEAQLGDPHATELIPRLQILTHRFPYRERLWGLFMRALQREGRQVEALAAYRTIRARLAEELGIDPSPELQEIEYQVLAQAGQGGGAEPTRTNLPASPSRLVGREREIARGANAVRNHRIVTITGPAGVGKTRVAIAVASLLSTEFTGGAFFVDLAAVSVPGDVPQAVAAGLMLQDQSGGTPAEAVASRLHHGRLLLVLDNCEHLSETVAPLASTWVNANPELHVLASSQGRLDVHGEHVLELSPLSLPGEDDAGSESVDLFMTLIRDLDPSMRLTPQAMEAVEYICTRLDGIPLAIELAAARARSISLAEIAARLDDRFALLTGGRRSSLHRHRSLRAAVEWSYSLLGEDAQRVFRGLSVLAGRFSLQSAEALSKQALGTASFLDVFDALIAGSLVARTGESRSSYRMLETLRHFGRALLEELGELGAMERLRAEHFAGVARRETDRIRTPDFVETWHRIDEELDDIRQAFRWSIDNRHPDLAYELSRVHWGLVFTGARHHLSEGREWRRMLLGLKPDDAVTARLLAEEAYVAFFVGDQVGAVELAENSREFSRRTTSTETLALQVLALCAATNQQTDRATELALRAVEVGGDDKDAHGLEALAFAYLFGGMAEQAVAAAEQVLVRADEQQYTLRRVRALALLGAALQSVDLDRSLATLNEAVSATEELGMEWDLAGAVMARGGTRWMRGELAGALEDLGRACQLSSNVRDLRRLAQTLEAIGGLVGEIGHPVEGLELLAASNSLRATIGVIGDEAAVARREAARTRLGRSLAPHLRVKAEAAGARVSPEEAARLGAAVAAIARQDVVSADPPTKAEN